MSKNKWFFNNDLSYCVVKNNNRAYILYVREEYKDGLIWWNAYVDIRFNNRMLRLVSVECFSNKNSAQKEAHKLMREIEGRWFN